MKIIFKIITLFLFFNNAFSQDLIILGNNDTIKCKIIEDKVSFLTYKLVNSSDSSIHQINQTEYDYYLIQSNNKIDLGNPYIIPEFVYTDSNTKVNKPIINGIYMSFEHFVKNVPTYNYKFKVIRRTDFDIAMMGGNDYKIEPIDSFPKSIIRNAWVICDSNYCYINCKQFSKNRFYSLLTFEKDYAYFSALPFKTSNAYSLAYMGGAIGGAIAGASAALERNLYKIYIKSGLIEPYYK